MSFFIKSVSSGFGRVLGRFLFYILIGFLAYLFIKKLGINLEELIPNIRRFIL